MDLQRTYKVLDKVIGRFLIFIFGLLVLDVLWQVFSRYILGTSYSFTEEFARFALIWLSILGAAYLNGKREHLAMDFLLKNLSTEDLKGRLQIIEMVMFVFAFLVMVVGGGNLVYTTLYLGQYSAAMHVPLGYVYAIVPISGLIIMFYSVYNFARIAILPPKDLRR